MKRHLAILILILISITAFSQEKVTKVVLKNGTTITGTLKELNPLSHLVISVSGFDTRIEMSDVAEVISSSTTAIESRESAADVDRHHVPNDILAIENVALPQTYTLECAGQSIEMVLIKGGRFMMGYDGKGSLNMHSDPVHEVFVSSFYVNKSVITKAQDAAFRGKGTLTKGGEKPYICRAWADVETVVQYIANETSLPVRAITEAEWEYMSSTGMWSSLLNATYGEVDFCYDFFDDYPEFDKLYINPMGPEKGKIHVRREFGPTKDIYCDRIITKDYSTEINSGACIRIVIPASHFIK